ncbi:MAG: hypothetical protein Q8R57_10965 [Bacteroidota bacterium]|nr:hypothetical protein [Bacteroidota bacterium]
MNMPSTHTTVFSVKENLKSVSGFWNSLYKVYARIEQNKIENSATIEIIDGYLNEGEELKIHSLYTLNNIKTKVLVVEIAQKTKKNTYLKTNSFDFTAQEASQVLVCIQKNEQFIGYQFIDIENNLLGEPKFSQNDLNFLK